jgi:hypothetical protein
VSRAARTRRPADRHASVEEAIMTATQGDLALLADPVAQALLHAPLLARLAYTWFDGTPRVVPIWFHWDGQAFVLGTPPTAPKVKALRRHPEVALTVDGHQPPYRALLVRGTARVELVPGATWERRKGPAGSNTSAGGSPGWRASPSGRPGSASSTSSRATRAHCQHERRARGGRWTGGGEPWQPHGGVLEHGGGGWPGWAPASSW